MASNTRESLLVAIAKVNAALAAEVAEGASEHIIATIAEAQSELNRAVLVQRAILSHRSGADFPEAGE